MLAGCSSTLLSPRHRLRSEIHIPTMSTQRLDLPCNSNFGRKEGSRSSQPIRQVGLSVDQKPIEGCSLRQSIKLPPSGVEKKKKRYAGELSYDDFHRTTKRKKGNEKEEEDQEEGHLRNFWFHPSPQLPFSLSCSQQDQEERVCFMPPPPLPPLSNIPWFDSVVTEITDLGEKSKGTEKEAVAVAASGSSSSTSPESRPNPVEHDVGNGSSRPNPVETGKVVIQGHNGDNNHIEHNCIELVSLLVACAEQITSKNIAAINHCLARLGELASPRGTSTVHRLVAYFTEALALRVARLWPNIFHITIPRELDRVEDETVLLNQVTPIPKFIHFTSNEILLRAFEGKDRVHIIDFDVKQGLQWPSLFQSLASRTNPPSHVRITGIGESKQELIETGDRLAGFAEALNLPFEFHPVVDRLEDVRLWMLHVKEKETVVVNCVFQLHKMLYDTTGGTIRDFLGLIRSTNARVVITAEQEAKHNEMSLDARLCNSLKYYSAIFDSVDSSLPLDSQVRMKIEEMFGREIRNIIGCEGRDRSDRHETFDRWQQVMEQGGYYNIGVSEREVVQGQMMLKMYSCEDYRVEKKEGENGASCLTLSWFDQPLYTVSAWMPVDGAAAASGSLSSYSQPS